MSTRQLLVIGALAVAAFALSAGCGDDDPAGPAADSGTPEVLVSGDSGPDGPRPTTEAGADANIVPPPASLPDGPRDRVGRPYVSLILVSLANRENYNLEPVDLALATDPPTAADGGTTFGADFQSRLVTLDGIDGVSNWDGGAADAGSNDAGVYPHPLTNPWIGVDALIVDPNMPFSTTSYLDVEANGPAHTTCGGRWFGDDALDTTMSYLVKRTRSGISDGVQAPAKPVSLSFPYLASPF